MSIVKVKFENMVQELKTTEGSLLKFTKANTQCGFGDCLCSWFLSRSPEDKKQGLISIDLCFCHKDIK